MQPGVGADPAQPLEERVASFQELASFAWIDPPLRETEGAAEGGDPFLRNTLLDKRVRDAVEAEFVARGFRRAGDGEQPDFQVRYQVVSRQVIVWAADLVMETGPR